MSGWEPDARLPVQVSTAPHFKQCFPCYSDQLGKIASEFMYLGSNINIFHSPSPHAHTAVQQMHFSSGYYIPFPPTHVLHRSLVVFNLIGDCSGDKSTSDPWEMCHGFCASPALSTERYAQRNFCYPSQTSMPSLPACHFNTYLSDSLSPVQASV